MRSVMKRSLLVLGPLLLFVSLADARRAAPPPIALRVAAVDAVYVGKATAFGPKLIPADLVKGDKRELQVATFQVGDALLGKAIKEIQVGFYPPLVRTRAPAPMLKLNEEVCVFLTKHPKKDLYVMRAWYDVFSREGNPDFAKQVEEARKAAKLLARPADGLKSKDADERYLTAALLVTKYRTMRNGDEKQEAIPAEESKRLLTILAEADWSGKNPKQGYGMAPLGLFHRLNLTAADGWTPPKRFAEFADEAKKWLRDNAGKYRIRRYVIAGPEAAEPAK